MARAETNKLYRTFVKGLITEAGPLTYPEDASIDEDNCIIYRRGNRSRRLGIDVESYGGANLSTTPVTTIGNVAMKEFRWDAVANIASLSFAVVQIGLNIHFFDLNIETVLDGERSFKIDLTPYVISGAVNPENCAVDFACGQGILFVAGECFEPILVEYSTTAETITAQKIEIQIRDMKGVADGLANDEEPATLSDAHHYNLLNQGWLAPTNDGTGSTVDYYNVFGLKLTAKQATNAPITTYFSTTGRYPGNNKQWWVAKDSTTNAFDANLLTKEYFGTSLAPRGHYVVNAFNIDRSAVSGVPNIPVETKNIRPINVAFANGRVWYLAENNVYFSQLMTDKSKAGMCYQEADPTSEVISDLIATDGGVIPITDMVRGVHLMPLGTGLVVFGTNGVWFIAGTSAGFTATDISVSEVSSIGTHSPDSILKVVDKIFWWSETGIQAMSQKQGIFGTVDGIFDKQNITQETIQRFYNDIPKEAIPYVKGAYDPETNVIQWLYWDEKRLSSNYIYNRVLNLDLTLGAFYPWTISYSDNSPSIIGVLTTPMLAGYKGDLDVTVPNTYLKYVCIIRDDPVYRLSFAQSKDEQFVDWRTRNSPGLPYLSFVETGYEILEDALRKKATPYVLTYFKRTEQNYIAVDDDFTTDRQSSCYFMVKWDWASSQVSGKYSTKREAYRHTRLPIVDPDNTSFDTGFPIVKTKHKVRGSGKSIQFRFESNAANKDFDLLGWAVDYTGNVKV